MEIVQKGAPRPVFKIRTSPTELRNVAAQMEAMAGDGNTLPGQVIDVPFRNLFDFEWDPEVSAEKFARGIYRARPEQQAIPAETVTAEETTQAPALTQ